MVPLGRLAHVFHDLEMGKDYDEPFARRTVTEQNSPPAISVDADILLLEFLMETDQTVRAFHLGAKGGHGFRWKQGLK